MPFIDWNDRILNVINAILKLFFSFSFEKKFILNIFDQHFNQKKQIKM